MMLCSKVEAKLVRSVFSHPVQASTFCKSPRYFTSTTRKRFRSGSDEVFKISKEVGGALESGIPVVALESTIYTHGFPYPDNVSLALDLENIVRNNGAVPATIGILNGVARVGLNRDEITALASAAGKPETMKISRRDMPYILGQGLAGRPLNGGTTISGTMMLASRAGIAVFGTGGLGGVHRGAETTMDISADLTELGRTPVAVISSGCKSFLDIPKTLEYLETQGVPVCTFADGRTGNIDFPAFFTRESGVKSPLVIQSAEEAAAMIYSCQFFSDVEGRGQGMLFANPIPETHSMSKAKIDFAIEQAVQEAADQGFHGHSNTPFILARIKELTDGTSIPANRALIESNVAMAAKVAVHLQKLRRSKSDPGARLIMQNSISVQKRESKAREISESSNAEEILSRAPNIQPEIAVFGSVAVDLSCDYSPKDNNVKNTSALIPQMYTSNIAVISPSIGGVGRNVALAAQLIGSKIKVNLVSAVGRDLAGNTILDGLEKDNLDINQVSKLTHSRTAQYVSVNDSTKSLVLAMADMSIFSSSEFQPNLDIYGKRWTVVDANWDHSVARVIMASARDRGSKVAFEPVSVPKSGAIFKRPRDSYINDIHMQKHKDHQLGVFPRHTIDLATPNQYELAAMHSSAKENELFESDRWWQIIDSFGIPSSGARDRFVSITNHKMTDEGIPLRTIQLLPYIPIILTKLGSDGLLMTELLKPDDPRLTDPDSAPHILSRNSNGSSEVGGVYMRLFPSTEVVDDADVASVNGVGDTFLGAIIAGLAKGLTLDERLIDIAQQAAVKTLRSKEAVSPDLKDLRKGLHDLVPIG